MGDQSIRTFDKVNSNRTYQLEKDSTDKVSLMVNITKGKKTGIIDYRNTNTNINFIFKENILYFQRTKKLISCYQLCYKKQKVAVAY